MLAGMQGRHRRRQVMQQGDSFRLMLSATNMGSMGKSGGEFGGGPAGGRQPAAVPSGATEGSPASPSYHRLAGPPWAAKAAHIAAGAMAGVQGSTLQPAWLGRSISAL